VCVWVDKVRLPHSVKLCFSAFFLLGFGEALGSGNGETAVKEDGGWGLRGVMAVGVFSRFSKIQFGVMVC
jgi:hypothetical protein